MKKYNQPITDIFKLKMDTSLLLTVSTNGKYDDGSGNIPEGN